MRPYSSTIRVAIRHLDRPPKCSIEGCGLDVTSIRSGLCTRHRRRLRAHGDPLGGRTSRGVAREFFEQAKQYEGSECLIWPFSKSSGGYAQIRDGNTMSIVSRKICEFAHGQPPSAVKNEAAHSCGNGNIGCIAKRHLRWATHAENMIEMVSHGRGVKGTKRPGLGGSRKLTAEQVREIRLLAATAAPRAIAATYSITKKAIYDILSRRTWDWSDGS